ncbi:HSP20-like chaperone [Leucosporidium creatinivorum]|uniref:HSP20-like chaperone n=1 Tax=Leucosporidium creatinivorum TaxID=106004 RepID=A0A1Y2ENV3_9BASI|nr:HSP20-like chaperone [Leucosporidium creatinivorum]
MHLTRIEHEDKNIVTFELAGLTKQDVDLSLHENLLTISGSLTTEKTTQEDASHLVCERRYGAFSRAITVPAGLKEHEIKASMEHGVLKIEFPKEAKESETKKITIA